MMNFFFKNYQRTSTQNSYNDEIPPVYYVVSNYGGNYAQIKVIKMHRGLILSQVKLIVIILSLGANTDEIVSKIADVI